MVEFSTRASKTLGGAPETSACFVDQTPLAHLRPSSSATATTRHFRRSLGRASPYGGGAFSHGPLGNLPVVLVCGSNSGLSKHMRHCVYLETRTFSSAHYAVAFGRISAKFRPKSAASGRSWPQVC